MPTQGGKAFREFILWRFNEHERRILHNPRVEQSDNKVAAFRQEILGRAMGQGGDFELYEEMLGRGLGAQQKVNAELRKVLDGRLKKYGIYAEGRYFGGGLGGGGMMVSFRSL